MNLSFFSANSGAGLIFLPGQADIAKRGWKVIAMKRFDGNGGTWTVKLQKQWDWREYVTGFKYECKFCSKL